MKTLTTLALALALCAVTSVDAKPRTKAPPVRTRAVVKPKCGGGGNSNAPPRRFRLFRGLFGGGGGSCCGG